MSQTSIPPRSEISLEHTWDVANVFPSDEAWESEFRRVSKELSSLGRFRGRLGDGPETLADWFETALPLLLRADKVFLYGRMGHNVDTADQDAVARNNRATWLFAQAQAATAFADPEMMEIGFETLRRWANEEPRLSIYAHYFDQLERRSEHVRSSQVEELLGQLMDPFRTATATYGILADADLTFSPAFGADEDEPIEIAQGNITVLLGSSERELRRTAWRTDEVALLRHGDAIVMSCDR